MKNKIKKLNEILSATGSGLIALSGGVDSSVLLALARDIDGYRIEAVTAASPAHPPEEVDFARELCRQFGIKHHVLEINELDNPQIKKNDSDRCYYCKRALYGKLLEIMASRGLNVVLDGSNADDKTDYRPGMRAVRELGVFCPLMEANITKTEIRRIAKEKNLLMWNAPASACLFTRIPTGEPLDIRRLQRIYAAERILHDRGFRAIRVRDHGHIARLEIPDNQFELIISADFREAIIAELQQIGYRFICLDLAGYIKGSMNSL